MNDKMDEKRGQAKKALRSIKGTRNLMLRLANRIKRQKKVIPDKIWKNYTQAVDYLQLAKTYNGAEDWESVIDAANQAKECFDNFNRALREI